ncbi:MAG TPA: hypothetical protein VFW87_01785, partial [Pirellulales bacterium]|nr:hypothetical protein [Pirellulales bacterium]
PKTQPAPWLLEYAKFRWMFVDGKLRHVQDRAVSVLRALAAVLIAAWTLFVWGAPRRITRLEFGIALADAVAALACLICAALVLAPREQTLALQEQPAFACLLDNPDGADPSARFAALVAETSDSQTAVLAAKATRLRWAFRAAAAALALALALLVAAGATQYRRGRSSAPVARSSSSSQSSAARPASPGPRGPAAH